MSAKTFSNSYMITNRKLGNDSQPLTKNSEIVAASKGTLSYFQAPGSYSPTGPFSLVESNVNQQQTPGLAPQSWLTDLTNDLKETQSSPTTDDASLTIYIDGMGNNWAIASNTTMQLGAALQTGMTSPISPPIPSVPDSVQLYTGLVVGFSWPSPSGFYSIDEYCAYEPVKGAAPKQQDVPNVRANIIDSLDSFQSLLTSFLPQVRAAVPGVTVNIVCHSEGNYMMMMGMEYIRVNGLAPQVDRTILLAADINKGALQSQATLGVETGISDGPGPVAITPTVNLKTGISSGPGSARGIAELAGPVIVFHSNNDTTLADSQYRCHNVDYADRLGHDGPADPTTVLDGVTSIDCTQVAYGSSGDIKLPGEKEKHLKPLKQLYDEQWIPKYEVGDSGAHISAHPSYRYVPQVLWVLAPLLNGAGFDPLPYNLTEETSNTYLMTFASPLG